MNIQAAIRARYSILSPHHQSIALLIAAFIGLLFVVLICKGCMAIASNKTKLTPEPLMIRQGNTIVIPSHSPLRTQIKVKTIHLSKKPHVEAIPGVVEAKPSHTVNILPPLTGRLLSLNVTLGAHVKQHQVLAIISAPDLAQASADHEKALSLLKLTDTALIRVKDVYLAGGTALKALQLAQNDQQQARAEVHRTAARLKTLRSNHHFHHLTLTAPTSGRITSINYGIGSYINDLTLPLMSLSNLDTVWMTAHVPENIVGVIEKNQAVDIRMPAYPNQVLHGKISVVSAIIEPDTHRNKTRITLANPDGSLQPNMFATVSIR